MIVKKKICIFFIAFFCSFALLFTQCAEAEEELIQAPALIQISSKVSDGRLAN